MIELRNVTATRAGAKVFEDFSLRVPAGQLTVIYGPSGTGKSTLCDLILGYIEPQSGTIEFNGATTATGFDQVGVVSQALELLNDRTIRENIALPLEIAGVKNARITDAIQNVLTRLGLESVSDAYPDSVAGNARQKAAIARAVVSEPFLLIADEPTLHLDVAASREIAEILRKEQVRGMTVLVLTGNPEFAALFPTASRYDLTQQVNYL